jgi:uncharacterized membrane protein YGL010W
MRTLDGHFADYADHHRHGLNKLTHAFGIPLIAMALLGLAARVPLFSVGGGQTLDLGLVLASMLVATYLAWHAGLALGAGLLCVPLYLLGSRLPVAWLWIALALGVGLQYVGHYAFERRKPAFHDNLVHTLVGPLWMVALLARALGVYNFRERDRR